MSDVPVLDMDALTEAQRNVLGLIAIGQDGGHNPRTLAVLERLGLIVGHDGQVSTPLGPMQVRRWDVPVAVHIQWCEWCSTQVDEEAPC